MIETRPRIIRIWKAHGRYCVAAENGLGFYIAYVMLEPEHPWYGKHYNQLPDIDVHGGLTYANHRDWKPEDFWQDAPDGIPEGWYIGFDTGHAFDNPIPGSYMAEHWPKPDPRIPTLDWTREAVYQETEKLALQADAEAIASGYYAIQPEPGG